MNKSSICNELEPTKRRTVYVYKWLTFPVLSQFVSLHSRIQRGPWICSEMSFVAHESEQSTRNNEILISKASLLASLRSRRANIKSRGVKLKSYTCAFHANVRRFNGIKSLQRKYVIHCQTQIMHRTTRFVVFGLLWLCPEWGWGGFSHAQRAFYSFCDDKPKHTFRRYETTKRESFLRTKLQKLIRVSMSGTSYNSFRQSLSSIIKGGNIYSVYWKKRIYIVEKSYSHGNANSMQHCRLPIKYKMTTMDVSWKPR